MNIELPVLNSKEALLRMENDIELYQELIDDFFTVEKNTPEKMRSLYNAAEYEPLRATAHRVKGALLALGAEKLADTSRSIELMIKENRINAQSLEQLLNQFEAGFDEAVKALIGFMPADS